MLIIRETNLLDSVKIAATDCKDDDNDTHYKENDSDHEESDTDYKETGSDYEESDTDYAENDDCEMKCYDDETDDFYLTDGELKATEHVYHGISAHCTNMSINSHYCEPLFITFYIGSRLLMGKPMCENNAR